MSERIERMVRVTMLSSLEYSGRFYPRGLTFDAPEPMAMHLVSLTVAILTPKAIPTKDIGALVMAVKGAAEKVVKTKAPETAFRKPRKVVKTKAPETAFRKPRKR